MYGATSTAVTTAWSNANTKVTAQYFKNLSTTNNGTVTLYAQWTAKTFTVTLNNQGATTAGTASVTATYDSAMPSATMPMRTGYTFNGYYDATSGGTQYYTASGASART